MLIRIGFVGFLALAILFVTVPELQQWARRRISSSETVIVPARPADTAAAGAEANSIMEPEREYEIITVLGFDAIPAILAPEFVSASEAEASMRPNEQVLVLSLNGEHRAYPITTLSRHEIVNDVVGGVPVAVTW